ncbi:hypothetical protein G647_04282 [Cladophialophora carrionii CBS 160.54]|uniref:Uncharacterized protein n=1 Tax=Cladophialophora carrionii CBS 160.54 TaxID=1279043 RepID=V9DG40_9EURO|nr:uncharacterized protein G647_04282 [Cladophialophora carrionii CBS 160.54]ETI24912.1 hypothetical protein G647_04282 [Cladophialophora carrionii CBS 160.54]
MSTRSYSIVEPHPNPSPSAHYISTGRGGAGNAIRTRGADATAPAAAAAIRASLATSKTSPSSVSTHSSTHRQWSTGGRGGAGNVFPASERAIFSFDEELERQLRRERDVAPVYHVGRGGAGNLMYGASGSERKVERRMSDDSGASLASTSSRGSESGADTFNRSVKKGWKKITGAH